MQSSFLLPNDMKNISKLLLTFSLITAASAVLALTPGAPTTAALVDNLPPAIQVAVKTGMKVDKSFPAASGLTGWILTQDGAPLVMYSTADGQTLIAGTLMDTKGTNLTAAYAEKYFEQPNLNKAIAKLEKSTYIVDGPKQGPVKSTVYAFLDPNCVYCHYTWQALRPYVEAGLQVRWIPVAYLRADSAGKAAAILEGEQSAAKGLETHELAFNQGGIAAAKVSAGTKNKLDNNSKLMQELGFSGTPALIYKIKNDWFSKAGMPRLSELPSLLSMPAIQNNDPDLQRWK